MRISFISFFPSILLLVCSPAFSAVPGHLDLEQAVKEGSQQSPEIQRAEAAAEEAGWKKTESLSGFLPSVNVQAEHFLAKKFMLFDINFNGNPVEFPAIYPTTTAALNLNLPIFDGLQNIYNLQSASSAQTAAEESYSWTQFQVSQKIRLNFLRALAAQDLKAVSDENLKTITDHLNQTQSLKKGGVATNYDVLRVEVQFSEAKSDVLRSNDDAILARRQLAIAMGMEGDARALEGKLPEPSSHLVANLRGPEADPGAFHRADIASLENQTEAASKSASAASGPRRFATK